MKFMQGWYQHFVDQLTTSSENPHAVDRFIFALFVCALTGPPTIIISVCVFFVAKWSAGLMTIFGVFASIGMVHVWVTKKPTFSIVLIYALTPQILLLDLSFGAGAQSPAVLSVSHLGPLFLILMDPTNFRRGLALYLFIVVVSLTTSLSEQTAGVRLTPQAPLPKSWHAVFTWVFSIFPGFVSFVFVHIGLSMMAENRQRLQESKCRAEQLNSQLIQQQERLEMQQSLTRSLIGNVFPETVCTSLIHLFEQSAKRIQQSVELVSAKMAERVACSATRKYIPQKNLSHAAIRAQEASNSNHTLPGSFTTPLQSAFANDVVSHNDCNELEPVSDTSSITSQGDLDTSCGVSSAESQPSSSTVWPRVPTLCRAPLAVEVSPRDKCKVRTNSPSTRGMVDLIVDTLAPKLHHSAAVLFADIVGFTRMASVTAPTALIQFLDKLFGRIDEVCQARKVEKIKTIGDCYMCVGWISEDTNELTSAWDVLLVAKAMHRIVPRIPLMGKRLSMRAGMHVGPVVSGIIGKNKFAFDIWGDAVNLASRMESTGVPGATQVTSSVYELLKAHEHFVPRGPVEVKGKGQVMTYISHAVRYTELSDEPPSSFPSSPRQFNVVEMISAWITRASPAR